MSLGRTVVIFFVMLGLSDVAFAQGSPSANPSAATAVKRKVSTAKKFSVGLGFMNFSESLQITESNFKNVGFANYAGLVALADYTLTKNRWIYQFGGGIASGKASAGGFSSIVYSDAGRRSWTLTFLEVAAHYRMNTRISFGSGLLMGNRSADWKSEANPLIQTKQRNVAIYAPEFLVRFNVSRKMTLVQSIASPDFRGNTIWRWSGQFNL